MQLATSYLRMHNAVCMVIISIFITFAAPPKRAAECAGYCKFRRMIPYNIQRTKSTKRKARKKIFL